MKSLAGTLAAPFPYFGGKALACETVWSAFGEVDNYVEPFAGSGGTLADEVRAWCIANGDNKKLRIVLCGHAGEHDEVLQHGWHIREWTARKGYAVTDEAVENSASETLWCSPGCIPEQKAQFDIFAEAA